MATYRLKCEPGRIEIKLFPIGCVFEKDLPNGEGRRIESHPPDGGVAISTLTSDGRFVAELSGGLKAGTKNEGRVVKVLAQALCASGKQIVPHRDAKDNRGEDAILEIDGQRTVVQVVSLPATQVGWKLLASGRTFPLAGSIAGIVKMLRHAIELKRGRAVGTLLAVDASHIGAVVGPKLVRAYCDTHGDPDCEFDLLETWLVGPTTKSTMRLSIAEI
jgi:hypothetical protein